MAGMGNLTVNVVAAFDPAMCIIKDLLGLLGDCLGEMNSPSEELQEKINKVQKDTRTFLDNHVRTEVVK